MFGGTAQSGTTIKFEAPIGQDSMVKSGQTTQISTRHQCITTMKQYEAKCLEELRFEDYGANRKSKQQTTGGLFGNTQPAATQASQGFGFMGNNTGFGTSTGFGAATSSSSGVFGQPATQTSSTSLFGTTSKPLFGSTPSTNTRTGFGFGTTTNTSQGNKPVFGATATTQQQPLFGSTTGTSSFGATSFGTGTAFGTPALSELRFQNYGVSKKNLKRAVRRSRNTKPVATQASQGFGFMGNNTGFGTSTGFGAATSSSCGVFGQPATQTSSTSLFGTTSKPLFGSTPSTNTSTGFGFGTTTNTSQAGSIFVFGGTAQSGTTIKFEAPIGQDSMVKSGQTTQISTRHQCITAMEQYEAKCLEELRFEDYGANRKSKQQTTGGLFGNTQPAATQASQGFGFMGNNTGFGTSTGFGAATSSSSGVFGQPATQTSSTSLFGTTSKPLFGSTPSTNTSTGFGFGTTTNTSQVGSIFMFGGTAQSGTTIKFEAPIGQDSMVKNGQTTQISTRHQCIAAMEQYEAKCLEELRFEDYGANRKSKQQTTGGLVC